ncbi:hypothetical protein Q3G72_015893 [Acer saccharum]|nr:hypothetical protein Q3G72_015893 [Acer saccharum]
MVSASSILFPAIALLLVLLILTVADDHDQSTIPSTLDGPCKPVTVPLDKSSRGNAVDLPDIDPQVQRRVTGFQPEQISVSLSSTYDSVWISWITDFRSKLVNDSYHINYEMASVVNVKEGPARRTLWHRSIEHQAATKHGQDGEAEHAWTHHKEYFFTLFNNYYSIFPSNQKYTAL